MLQVLIRKQRTPAELLGCFEDPGKPAKRLTGGWVLDLVALKKCIWLCDLCKGKFAAARHDYVTKSNLPFVRGRCDGCKDYVPRATLFVPAGHDGLVGRTSFT